MNGQDEPMDEFQWEDFLKKNDAMVQKYATLLVKYMNHPDGDAMIDKEMGWDRQSGEGEVDRPWLEDFRAALEESDALFGDTGGMEDDSPYAESEDDPLYHMGFSFSVDFIQWCDRLPETIHNDPDMAKAMQHCLIPAAKIAGAAGLEDEDKEMLGLKLATYKRGLSAANNCLAGLSAVNEKGLVDAGAIFPYIKRATELRNALAMRVIAVREKFLDS